MQLNMDRLRAKGINSIGIEISVTDVNPAVAQILKRNCIDANDAQIFSIKTIGSDERNEKSAVLGRLDAVLHKNTRGLNLRDSLKGSKCLAFIYMLFTELEYTGCGIASNMLENLHVWIKEEFGFTIDAELLTPAPQWKNEDGEIIQIPMGLVFLHQQKRLVAFYLERGFNLNDDFLTMYK